ncbi:Uncharacterized protein APZ42_031501 [Daphnia magna]|uniref:CxC3 like cysteine cluster domain-containing protein n=1 Tax=Daphnia magna TaxID=35525 RepID=A0A164MTB1_9CRUS|nr:Uncharacterized protein APZ42_031501 [Daphnia magna]
MGRKKLSSEEKATRNRIYNEKRRKEVAVPVSCPVACWSCLNPETCRLIPGSSPCIIVTKDGRFDLYESLFKCKSCDTTRTATVEDNVAAGYIPGTPKRTNFFVSFDLAEILYNFKYLTPGTSEQKFIETLSAVSIKAGTVGLVLY